MTQAPFTAHIKINPSIGKRFETIRSLQRLANLIYGGPDGISGLIGNTNIQVATPGGGQANQMNAGDQTDYYPGCAVKPQFGETPAQLMITGFYLAAGNNTQPWPDKQVISAGSWLSGAGGSQGYLVNPNADVAADVKAIKAIFDSIIALEVPTDIATLFRLDYKGVIFGDRGFTWPS